ncbi:hypothetical protein Tco_0874090 [Tanacetum coccineum]|uniref:Uncharacterized protein n=1 Tax=Tanacetum coccineum TaxID=301880 RepID=A0ABQ5BRB3_9ASTR
MLELLIKHQLHELHNKTVSLKGVIYFKHSPSVVSTTISATTLPPLDTGGDSSSTTIDEDAPSLRKNAFSGTNGEDAVEHIENFLKVIDLIKVPKIYERNNGIPWVEEKPWTNDEECAEPMGIFQDEYCNTGDLPELICEGNLIRYENYGWYDTIEDSELREEALNNKRILEESMNGKEESSDDERSLDSPIDEWEDYEPAADIEADDNSNYNPYLDISQLFNDHTRKNEEDIGQDRIELNNDEDDDMGHLEDHLVHENEPFIINKKEEGFNE